MSYIVNDPATFAEDSARGFFAAHGDIVRPVRGGAVRRTATPPGQVAVVVGGGSGHYPAFAGLVGPGLAHGAAMGNVFASPSAHQVRSVARAAESGAGVLLCYGNYAGDVLNFDQADALLREEGIPCRSVTVTDDICSAPPLEKEKRRGIAGDLVVFRAAAWAAEQGYALDDVAALASRANDRTRSLGISFTGCTLPGASSPLFTVPAGQMAVGMGIHGEPGLDVRPRATGDELAKILVAGVLDDFPDEAATAPGTRMALILNGLGAVKGEELFLVYGEVARLLDERGIVVVQPDVGEFATSFEMAGLSLTLTWLDDDLERAWCSPAAAPAYRKGILRSAPSAAASVLVSEAEPDGVIPTATATSRTAAQVACAALIAVRDRIDAEADELGRLDAVAGDGDHGIGMQRGAHAAAHAAEAARSAGAGAGTTLVRAGDAWADKSGGTSGALWGAGLRAAGERIGDTDAPDVHAVAAAVEAALAMVQRRGGAAAGDKTLVDALLPFATELRGGAERGETTRRAWGRAVEVATLAAEQTADLVARRGRARPHATRSLGTPDPGAISFAHAMGAIGTVIATKKEAQT